MFTIIKIKIGRTDILRYFSELLCNFNILLSKALTRVLKLSVLKSLALPKTLSYFKLRTSG